MSTERLTRLIEKWRQLTQKGEWDPLVKTRQLRCADELEAELSAIESESAPRTEDR